MAELQHIPSNCQKSVGSFEASLPASIYRRSLKRSITASANYIAIDREDSKMSDPIPDKAEVAIDFPDKFYMGSFGGESRFDVSADLDGVHIHLDRPGDEKRHVGFHLHYSMAAGLLHAMGDALSTVDGLDAQHLGKLREAVAHLAVSIPPPRS